MKLTQLNKPVNVLRRNSNQKIKTLATKELAGETEKMSQKLEALKQQFELEKNNRKQPEKQEILNVDSGSRWRPSSSSSKVTIQNVKVQKKQSVEKKTISREKLQKIQIIKSDSLQQFLTSIQMQDYIEIFQQNGFDDESLLFGRFYQPLYKLEIKNEHLDQMKIPKGHQIRLLKKIREKQNNSVEESCYVALDDLMEEDYQFQPKLKGSLQNKVLVDSSSMTQSMNTKQKMKKNVSFNDGSQKHDIIKELSELAKYLHFNDEKEEWKNKANSDIQQEFSTQTEAQTFEKETKPSYFKLNLPLENPVSIDVKSNKNKSCWQCFKVILKDHITLNGKYFCKQSCQNKFLEENNISCSNNQCTSTIFKGEGLFLNGYWFCSEECMKLHDYQILKTNKEQMDKYFKLNQPGEENNPLNLTDENIDLNFENINFNE